MRLQSIFNVNGNGATKYVRIIIQSNEGLHSIDIPAGEALNLGFGGFCNRLENADLLTLAKSYDNDSFPRSFDESLPQIKKCAQDLLDGVTQFPPEEPPERATPEPPG